MSFPHSAGVRCAASRWRREALLAALLALLPATARAAGVEFQYTSLPSLVRQDGITEVMGEIALTAVSVGTILSGSTIDVDYGVTITNDTSLSTGNISKASNVFCTNPSACPSSATLVGSSKVRLIFSADTAFTAGNRINISRVRANANAAAGAAIITATVAAFSPDIINNPILFSQDIRTVGEVRASIFITPNPGGTPIKQLRTCNLGPGTTFRVRISGRLSSLTEETMLSPAAASTNGTSVRLTLSGIPAGLTLGAPTTTVENFLPLDGGSFPSTGAPIVLNYTVATSSSGFAAATLTFDLFVTGGGSQFPQVGTPVNIQASAQVLPITAADTVIVRFVDNSYGPETAASISDCRPVTSRLISD